MLTALVTIVVGVAVWYVGKHVADPIGLVLRVLGIVIAVIGIIYLVFGLLPLGQHAEYVGMLLNTKIGG